MSTNQPRKPAGTPAGGQWAPMGHAEPEVELTPSEHRQRADQADAAAQASFERCDTDGFLSQWALGLTAQKHRLAARIAEDGGRAEFPALFDLEGNLVPAKLAHTRYGAAWGLLGDESDPDSRITRWIGLSKADSPEKRLRALEKKGYREGTVRAKAKAEILGTGHGLSGTAWVAAVRTDGGFSRDVEVVDDGRHGAAVTELTALAQRLGVKSEDLEDDVYDAKVDELGVVPETGQAAFEINAGGRRRQISYLVESRGPEAVRQRLATGSWDKPAPATTKDWWPMVASDRWPGEQTLACPECGSQDVSITGSNLGSDVVRGNNYTRLVCGSCRHSQDFPRPRPK